MAVELEKLYVQLIPEYNIRLCTQSCFEKRISWIHMVEDIEFTQFLHGNELLFNSGLNYESNEWLKKFIDCLCEKNAGGLIVGMHDGMGFPQEIVDYCNEKKLPLFSASWDTPYIDIMRLFSEILLKNEQIETNLVNALKNAIYYPDSQDMYQNHLERNGFFEDYSYNVIRISCHTYDTDKGNSILEDLERNMDGYQQSVKAVMRAAGGGRLRGIIGPVAGIITVEKGYETAIETALGFALQNIVVEDQGCARAAIGFLKDERAGRATFLPLDTVQGSRFTGRLTGTAEVAADLVRTDPKYQHIIDNLLGRIIVVEDLTEASAVARNLGYRNRIVTLDGQVINAGGSFTGGSTARSVGVFSRKQELDELRSKLTKLEQKRTEAEKELAARKAEVDNLSAQLAGAEGEGMNAATEHVRANLELERLTKAAAQYDETARSIEAEIAAQQAAVTRNETARTEAEKARTDAEAELAQYTAELAALGESTGSLTAEREKITGELSEKQLQRLADEKDVGLHEAALEGLRSRTGEADARARELQTAIEAAKAKIEANALKIAEMERVRGDNQQKIAAAEETIRSANAARLEREAAISKLGQDNRALTDERERMSGEMARLAERRTAAETELNDTNSKLWEEYQLTESEARSQCVPFESLTELRRSVTEVRGKIRALGNVNVGAIDEYKEVRERYDFMKAQVTDVEKAKAELTKMIAELCSEMQELFTASFKQINANFQQIFKELFGGGHARLYLSDEANVLESGIEIEVSPPGKVIKNLSALSGGEQALVAISIYFAILRVNPAPFCFLDEIEAALDDVNVARYAQYLRRMTDRTQFIVITHRRGTMEAADVLYGVTMQEDGVSKILRLDLDNVSADLIT